MTTERQLSVVLSEFARTMLTDFPIQGILDHLVKRIVDILPITAAGVTLISPATTPRYVAASDESALLYEQLQTELGEGPCLAAYSSGGPVAISDLRTDRRFKHFGPRAIEAGLVAVFTFPLYQDTKPLGALDLYRQTPGTLSDANMVVAQTLADVTAAYLVNAQARADLQESSDRSHEISMHDALTGLPNRLLLIERLRHALLRCRRSKKIVAILFIDLDRFKVINDAHGHQAGDDLLIAVAARITRLLRPGDTLARLSGDEFVILSEELNQTSEAESIARRIVDILGTPFPVGGIEMDLTGSVGIAFADPEENDPEHLLKQADVAMYQVKRKGGDDHQIVDLSEQYLSEHRAGLRRDVDHALKRQQLRVEYQPVVRSGNGLIVGAEALLRWDHPTRGAVTPMSLIPLAEETGAIVEIGRWVLRQACVDRNRWVGHRGNDSFGMAVNVSAHQLLVPNFVAMVEEVLVDTSTNPDLLTLEITESALVRDPERAFIVLDELKQLGVLLALDDFGTGYSSLSYLKRFPVDVVKLDQSFISDLLLDRTSHAIVTKIIELVHILNLTVVSEGVETMEQHDEVTALGSDFCQGFYFARPMRADTLDDLVGEGSCA